MSLKGRLQSLSVSCLLLINYSGHLALKIYQLCLSSSWSITYGQRSFYTATPTLWNSLPEDFRDISFFSSFRNLIIYYESHHFVNPVFIWFVYIEQFWAICNMKKELYVCMYVWVYVCMSFKELIIVFCGVFKELILIFVVLLQVTPQVGYSQSMRRSQVLWQNPTCGITCNKPQNTVK